MKETFYERIGEAVCRERLTNGLEVCVVPKPGYAKKYAFFSTRYGGMDTRFCLDGQWYLAVSPQGIQCQNVYGCGWFAIHGDWRGDCTLSEFHELDAGFDYYAPQSFVDGNGRRIQIGWMGMPDADYGNAPTVAYGWQHCFTVPRVLTAGPDGTLLQNIAPTGAVKEQAMAVALAVAERALKGRGACRVHGGGFAGTIQAFVPLELLDGFREQVESVLGAGSCHVLRLRPVGGVVLWS